LSDQSIEPKNTAPNFPPETTIEGEKICVNAQKINPSGRPFKISAGVNLHSIKAFASAKATIDKEYPDLVGKPQFCKKAALKQGDEIAGKIISAFGCRIGKLEFGTESSRSSGHKRQTQILRDGAMATVQESQIKILIGSDPRKMLMATYETKLIENKPTAI